MKTRPVRKRKPWIWTAALILTAALPLRASPDRGPVEIVSPSHPATFYTGTDKISQDLSWDAQSGTLTGDVTYSLVLGSGDELMDPFNYKTFVLEFPTVRKSARNELYVESNHRHVSIGHLESGAFGTQVRVNPGVNFIAHRVKGKLGGEIVVGPQVQ